MKAFIDIRSVLGLVAAMALFTACKKEEGEGGRAEIQGVVYEQRYNSNGLPSGNPYPVADQRVYIIYGDGAYADNDTRTGPTGEYHFPWLRKGSYKIYVISECNTYTNCVTAIYNTVEIGSRKEVVTLDRITIANY